ncbi:general secretion pathway protein GspB [Vibrio coralliilyticus]|uniref:general secretion pathway protein GspB n=1 Tax=Vibrio coralliilyticus TaxID=190893 RepID=UPI00155FA404|nr:general secretion pathway protein GspB [Vibrio coralliilyticus]NRF26667.1 general secretion pathway protein GspB [Vibrio coralliilyticus]NRF80925.1 general secretion pathway protein GspB [Vibrio coralliilyticus]
MSKVLQALDHSEQNHQTFNGVNHYQSVNDVRPRRTVSGWLLATVIVAPALVTGALSTYQSYLEQRGQWQASHQAKPQVLEVPFAYQTLPYPSFSELRETYEYAKADTGHIEVASEETQPPVVQPQEPVQPRVQPPAQSQNSTLLDGLDLSGLSPELAMRVESALESSANPEPKYNDSEASDLAIHSRQWQGKLPPLNFQTHVYSSNPDKRWVKVNGTEYREGDWISNDIQLQHIEPQRSAISFKGSVIEVPALYDWKG